MARTGLQFALPEKPSTWNALPQPAQPASPCPLPSRPPKKSRKCASPAGSPPRCSTTSRPHVKPGMTTGELDRLCHDYMVNVQAPMPAPLNYAPPGYQPYPKSICTSVNHVGVPRRPGRQEAEGRRHRQHRHHRHQGRLPRRHEPHVLRRPAVDPGASACATSPTNACGCGIEAGAARRAPRRHRPRDPDARREARLQRRARVLRPRHRPQVPRRAAGPALRPARHRAEARGRA